MQGITYKIKDSRGLHRNIQAEITVYHQRRNKTKVKWRSWLRFYYVQFRFAF